MSGCHAASGAKGAHGSDAKRSKKSRRAWPRRLLVEMALCGSPFDEVAALSILALCRHELEPHPLVNSSAQEATHRMRQPARDSHEFFQRSAVRPPQQAQDLGCLAALAGTGGGFGLFGGLWLSGRGSAELAFPISGSMCRLASRFALQLSASIL